MKNVLGLGFVLLLCCATLASADSVIQRGIDVFTTLDNGKTFYSFADNPIPAGFFCKGSEPFAGTIALKGLPLETDPPGKLRKADTVIERLSDAAFDNEGLAQTTIRVRALSLVSSKPLSTSCGDFHVYVSLNGEQRATTMRIYQTAENGGHFVAPLAIDARMLFVPVTGSAARPLELTGSFTFPAQPVPWRFEPGPGVKKVDPITVDTNADRIADALLVGTTNFAPGWQPASGRYETIYCDWPCVTCEPGYCHEGGGEEQHCTGPVCACSGSGWQAYCP